MFAKFLVILCIQDGVDGGHAFGSCYHGLLIYLSADFLSASFSPGDLRFCLFPDGCEPFRISGSQALEKEAFRRSYNSIRFKTITSNDIVS